MNELGRARDVLERLMHWGVIDDTGSPVKESPRRELIRFGKAAAFIANTSFVGSDAIRLHLYGWLQNEAQLTAHYPLIRDHISHLYAVWSEEPLFKEDGWDVPADAARVRDHEREGRDG